MVISRGRWVGVAGKDDRASSLTALVSVGNPGSLNSKVPIVPQQVMAMESRSEEVAGVTSLKRNKVREQLKKKGKREI